MKRVGLIAIVATLGCTVYGAKNFWEQKPYPEWSVNEVAKMLRNSPWGQSQVFGASQASGAGSPTGPSSGGAFPSPLPGAGHNFTRVWTVRFQSAAPIRMALARSALITKSATPEQAQRFVETKPVGGDIVVTLYVSRNPLGRLGEPFLFELERTTTDLLKNDTFLILKQSKKRIRLKRYLTPSETGEYYGTLLFPRLDENGKELIQLEEKEVRFVCQLGSAIWVNRSFKLKDMVINGQLEI